MNAITADVFLGYNSSNVPSTPPSLISSSEKTYTIVDKKNFLSICTIIKIAIAILIFPIGICWAIYALCNPKKLPEPLIKKEEIKKTPPPILPASIETKKSFSSYFSIISKPIQDNPSKTFLLATGVIAFVLGAFFIPSLIKKTAEEVDLTKKISSSTALMLHPAVLMSPPRLGQIFTHFYSVSKTQLELAKKLLASATILTPTILKQSKEIFSSGIFSQATQLITDHPYYSVGVLGVVVAIGYIALKNFRHKLEVAIQKKALREVFKEIELFSGQIKSQSPESFLNMNKQLSSENPYLNNFNSSNIGAIEIVDIVDNFWVVYNNSKKNLEKIDSLDKEKQYLLFTKLVKKFEKRWTSYKKVAAGPLPKDLMTQTFNELKKLYDLLWNLECLTRLRDIQNLKISTDEFREGLATFLKENEITLKGLEIPYVSQTARAWENLCGNADFHTKNKDSIPNVATICYRFKILVERGKNHWDLEQKTSINNDLYKKEIENLLNIFLNIESDLSEPKEFLNCV